MANHGRRGGGAHRGGRRARGGPRNAFVPQSAATASLPALHPHAFSLQDEIRNTGHRSRLWDTDVRLRHKAITFVSAGNLAGTIRDEPVADETALLQETIADALAESETAMAQMNLEPTAGDVSVPPVARSPSPALPFFEDTAGSSAPVETGLPAPVIRSSSPTPSDSSEEVVLFRGRNQVKTVTESHQPAKTKSSLAVQASSRPPASSGSSSMDRLGAAPMAAANGASRGSSARRLPPRKGRRQSSASDDEAIADYLENVMSQQYGDAGEALTETVYATSALTPRALGLMDGDEWDGAMEQKAQDLAEENPHRNDWDSPQLQDFDNLSTSSEILGNIDRILRKRERSSGVQYLVVFENSNEDEARWLPVARIAHPRDQKLIAAFEEAVATVKFGNEADGSDSWSDASEDEDEDEDEDDEDEDKEDGDESFEDEKDLVQRKIDRMSDERIARLLAKQEELGLGSDELLLFDDDEEENDDLGLDGLDAGIQGFATRRTRRKQQKAKRSKDNFPSASLMADVLEQDPYNGFDIMDFDRPSLRKKKKGRAADLSFELSDEELSAQLRATWEADRTKKRLKKQEREELRAQGLLGKKNKFKPDLTAKYNEGMSFIQMKEEIKVFLNSPHQSRPFPPMDKRDRAALHQLGAALGLNSRSVGSGTSRFTTLFKTSRTRVFDEVDFAKITSRYHGRFAPRMDKRGGGKRSGGSGGGGGGKYAAVSYRDGDVVGGSAPEIGADNKGRAMLEKMGWSSGTALGAINNKGILQPVTHVVKTTKTGLG